MTRKLFAIIGLTLGMAMLIPEPANAGTVYILEPVAAEGQKAIPPTVEVAVPKLASKIENIVLIGPQDPTYKKKGDLAFNVVVMNRTAQDFSLSTENISGTVNGDSSDVLTFEQLEENERKAASKKRMFNVFAAVALTTLEVNAAVDSGGAYQGLFLDAAMSIDQSIVEQANDAVALYSETILEPGDVIADQGYGGYFVLDRPKTLSKDSKVVLNIDAGGEVHEFTFKWVKTTSKCQETKNNLITMQRSEDQVDRELEAIGGYPDPIHDQVFHEPIRELQASYDKSCP